MDAAALCGQEHASAGVSLFQRRASGIGVARQKLCGRHRTIYRKAGDFVGIHADGLVMAAPAAGVT